MKIRKYRKRITVLENKVDSELIKDVKKWFSYRFCKTVYDSQTSLGYINNKIKGIIGMVKKNNIV